MVALLERDNSTILQYTNSEGVSWKRHIEQCRFETICWACGTQFIPNQCSHGHMNWNAVFEFLSFWHLRCSDVAAGILWYCAFSGSKVHNRWYYIVLFPTAHTRLTRNIL